MTLLACAITPDRAVIGADGTLLAQADAPGGLAPFSAMSGHKIRRLGGHPLYWGICGSLGDYGQFDRWARTADLGAADWDGIADQVQVQVDALNRASEDESLPPVALLVVGRAAGELGAVIFEKGRRPTFPHRSTVREHFVGVYGPTANTAWRVLRAYQPDLSLAHQATMERFMRSLHDPLPILGEPFHTECVTKA